MLRDYFLFAWNSLTHKKLRSWLTLLGIFIGVTAVVALIGLGNGLKVAVSSQFGISTTEVLTVQAGGISGAGPPGTGVTNPLTTKDVTDIEKLPSVDMAISRVIETGPLEFGKYGGFGFAMNVPDKEKRKFVYDTLEFKPLSGRLLNDGDRKKVLLGYNFGTDVNDFNKALKPGDHISFKGEEFQVVGILKKKGSFIFDNILVLNDVDIQALMVDKEKVSVIVVKAKSKDLLNVAKLEVEKLLRKNRDVKEGEEDFEVRTPAAALGTVNSVLTGVQIFVVLIAAISIFVGAIGIINTMTTAVLERKNQIGVMKSIGAKNSDIFMQFFIESGMMGLLGGIIGVIFGELISYVGNKGISSFLGSVVVPEINYVLIIGTLVGTFLIGCIAGIAPAMQAARQHPVDALRAI
jgi:putative ABC transport system permease protein